MPADPKRVATRWLAGEVFSRARAQVLLEELDGAPLRWNRDWWLVLESLVDGEPIHADEHRYAFHAIRTDIKRAESAGLSPEKLALLTELQNLFAARAKHAAAKKWNPWTAPLGQKRPAEPEKGSYEAYVKRKKDEGEEPRSKEEWERFVRQKRFPIDG